MAEDDDPSCAESAHVQSRKPLRQVRLGRLGDRTVVTPPHHGSDPGPWFEDFPLGKLPKSVTDQLSLFGDRLWQLHRRCVGVLLLLDTRERDWTVRVPRQRCGRTASCWSALVGDVPGLGPDLALAGTFQTRVLSPGEEPAHAPPPNDGMHLVQVIEPERQVIWCFVRSGGELERVPAGTVVFDDLEATLEECMPRLAFDP